MIEPNSLARQYNVRYDVYEEPSTTIDTTIDTSATVTRRVRIAGIMATDEGSGQRGKAVRKRIRLSREAIVAEAAAMLREGTLEALTLRRLADRLGAGPMSLYTYYRNRDALLNAVAEYVFALFEPPPADGPWQDYVRNWLWATYRHFIDHPIAPKVIFWDGHVASAWLKTWVPVAEHLKAHDVHGARLAFAMDWFSLAAMGFIASQIDSHTHRKPGAVANIADLTPDQQRLAAELWLHFQDVDQRAILEFGFASIIGGLEAIVRGDIATRAVDTTRPLVAIAVE